MFGVQLLGDIMKLNLELISLLCIFGISFVLIEQVPPGINSTARGVTRKRNAEDSSFKLFRVVT